MRSAKRLKRTPAQFRQGERAEQAQLCDRLLDELAAARERGEGWYVWVRDVAGPWRRGELPYDALHGASAERS